MTGRDARESSQPPRPLDLHNSNLPSPSPSLARRAGASRPKLGGRHQRRRQHVLGQARRAPGHALKLGENRRCVESRFGVWPQHLAHHSLDQRERGRGRRGFPPSQLCAPGRRLRRCPRLRVNKAPRRPSEGVAQRRGDCPHLASGTIAAPDPSLRLHRRRRARLRTRLARGPHHHLSPPKSARKTYSSAAALLPATLTVTKMMLPRRLPRPPRSCVCSG
jgi:hypothetical protein